MTNTPKPKRARKPRARKAAPEPPRETPVQAFKRSKKSTPGMPPKIVDPNHH